MVVKQKTKIFLSTRFYQNVLTIHNSHRIKASPNSFLQPPQQPTMLHQHFLRLFFATSFLYPVVVHGQARAITLSALDQTSIVDAINGVRAGVSPPASDMIEIVWDETLATAAETDSLNCEMEIHDPPNGVIAAFSSVVPDYAQIITQSWNSESSNFAYAANQCTIPGLCDNYKQLVWASSTNVGCAAAACACSAGTLSRSCWDWPEFLGCMACAYRVWIALGDLSFAQLYGRAAA